jgi:hypothetical protein
MVRREEHHTYLPIHAAGMSSDASEVSINHISQVELPGRADF